MAGWDDGEYEELEIKTQAGEKYRSIGNKLLC